MTLTQTAEFQGMAVTFEVNTTNKKTINVSATPKQFHETFGMDCEPLLTVLTHRETGEPDGVYTNHDLLDIGGLEVDNMETFLAEITAFAQNYAQAFVVANAA